MLNHWRGETWIRAEEQGRIHDCIGPRVAAQCGSDSSRAVLFQLDKDRLPEEVTAEEHAVADLVGVEMMA